jgi:PAS domain S-box-containing protein
MNPDNNFLEAIVQNTTDVIFVKDLSGRYLFLNKSAEGFIGKKTEDVVGKDDYAIFPSEIAKNLMQADKKIMESGVVSTFEETATSHTGVSTTFLSTKGPFFDKQGKVAGIFGIAKDITDRKNSDKKVYEDELFITSVIENIPDMIFIKDAKDLRFTHFNKAAEDLLGYRREDMLGKNDYDLFPKEQADFFTKIDRDVLSNMKILDIPEEKILTKNLGERVLHTKKLVLLDKTGKPAYLLGISEDITDKKRDQDNLRSKLGEIEKMNEMMVDREVKMVELKGLLEKSSLKEESKN